MRASFSHGFKTEGKNFQGDTNRFYSFREAGFDMITVQQKLKAHSIGAGGGSSDSLKQHFPERSESFRM